jgi:glycosyltransferase involved in cell wall biosynthesis
MLQKPFRWMTDKKQSLIFLSPGFASSEHDSTCLPMQQRLIRAIKRSHPDLEIFILAFQYPYRKDNYKWCDCQVISFNGRNRGGLSKYLLRNRIYEMLERISNQTEIRGMVSFWYGECAYVGERFTKKHQLKHYCWVLGQDARKNNPYVDRVRMPGDRIMVLSHSLQSAFQNNYLLRPEIVLPPGIDIIENTTLQTKRDIDILGVGSFIPLKQFEYWIEVVGDLKQRKTSVNAVLAGDGPERAALKVLVLTYGLNDHVQFTGELPHAQTRHLMMRSKILLHPSSYEGFSGVCQEALAAGAHVVSFCKPMNEDFPHWHVVDSVQQMKETVFHLLNADLDHSPVAPFSLQDSVGQLMNLFK